MYLTCGETYCLDRVDDDVANLIHSKIYETATVLTKRMMDSMHVFNTYPSSFS